MTTVLDALTDSLKSAVAGSSHLAAPTAVLWTDRDREWEEIVPLLRPRIPILTLGPFDPGALTGPAIWIRCMLSRSLPEAEAWDAATAPIVYLPGYSRADLRAVEDCPEEIKALACLQYSGLIWSQTNNRDWTLAAFVQTRAGGLGIAVASDRATIESLRRAAPVLAEAPVEELRRNAPIKAGYLNGLVAPDLQRLLLLWMNDPPGQKAKRAPAEWEAFCSSCLDTLHFDPEKDGELHAAELLAEQEGEWKAVWQRFCEAPGNYPAVPELLRKTRTGGVMHYEPREVWPQDNEAEEKALRAALAGLAKSPPADAAEAVRKLDSEHGRRREWVWAKLGQTPLASALEHLVTLADAAKPLGSDDPHKIAERYAAEGWQADAAAVRALASVGAGPDSKAVAAVLNSLYRPWLTTVCEGFQAAAAKTPLTRTPVEVSEGTAVVFVDGLRMDAAMAMRDRLHEAGFECETRWRFAALPTVTPTAKPEVAPVGDVFGPGPELAPARDSGAVAGIDAIRGALEAKGFQVLAQDETGDPSGRAWVEAGKIDEAGHQQGWKLAHRLAQELRTVVERAQDLLEAGWKQIAVLTDHGWLLCPGGLPKHELPEVATVVRKGRCARLKDGAKVDCQTVPWHWDPDVSIAVAPGMSCFVAGKDYEHGGLSPQECVTPVLLVSAGASARQVEIVSIQWRGLRCNLQATGAEGLSADLRQKAGDPSSSLVQPKAFDAGGKASLVCENYDLEGQAALVVAFDPAQPGSPLTQQHTTVGGGE